MTFLLANATVATLFPPSLRSVDILVRGDRIDRISDTALVEAAVERIDCAGRIIIPGNVCAHTHLYSALARGMPGPSRQPTNFREILQLIWWRLDRALDEPGISSSALMGALDALHAGTTTLVDHHASPNAIAGSLDIVADALAQVGVRSVLCYEVSDRDGRDSRDAGLAENDRFLRDNTRPLARGAVGAHASFTLEDDSLAALAELADQHATGVHIHLAEDAWDEEDSLRRSGQRTAGRLADARILRTNSIAAHGVHLDDSELKTVQDSSSWLVHNCRSNLNNCVGYAPVARFGRRAALGTDGIDADMFAESRTAFFRAREASLATPAEEFARLLAGGAALATDYFGAPLGTIEPGAYADLVVLKYDPPTELSADNLAWHWMFGLTAAQVESVMVGGAWVMRSGQVVGVDEEKVRSEARSQATRLWKRMEEL